ncbi:hypothetical protein ACFS5N_17230 [Mucilaginibacter ximonensis]|uniref:MutS-like protein n=1 Tax=Mucilaginibacter ximonensis TaxID=538021 RepID=A0ABW5YFS7_9SPHI
MAFLTDKQTLDDLNIFGHHNGDSIYSIFNRCVTRGGAAVLEDFFRSPLSDVAEISRRSEIIKYFASAQIELPFQPAIFDALQVYLSNTDERSKLVAQDVSLGKKVAGFLNTDVTVAQIQKGILAAIELVKGLHRFAGTLKADSGSALYQEMSDIQNLLSSPVFENLLSSHLKPSSPEMAKLDDLIRFKNPELMNRLITHIYQLDVFISVGKVASDRKFSFAQAHKSDGTFFDIIGFYHPRVQAAVPNSINITNQQNVIFLTGANMAGKSTLMKSLSIVVYLAHMGFPVPAEKMTFSVLDGIYSTINLSDNLGLGASHFYAEVLRIKKIAQELRKRRLFVVFDELFRGTNVKDAGEATKAFTEAFSRKSGSVFIISTHIIEAGESLKETNKRINFVFLPTIANGNEPIYTYQLQQGITADRHGMLIVNNEGILNILIKGQKTVKEPTKPVSEFNIDKQTLTDLNILGKYNPNSIFSLFNNVKTSGGERLLNEMFTHLLTDADQINTRSNLFRYFGELTTKFPISNETFLMAESYFAIGTATNFIGSAGNLLLKKAKSVLLQDDQYDKIYAGLLASIHVLTAFYKFLQRIKQNNGFDNVFGAELKRLLKLYEDSGLTTLIDKVKDQNLSLSDVIKYDHYLKNSIRDHVETILNSIYKVDVFLAVGNTAADRGFFYATALPAHQNTISSTALWHPSISRGVPNPISFSKRENMIFLTGANMAGKSTLMKAVGIAVYLAHMGFPVAAKEMQFSVMDGLYTSINVSDNLNLGYSHFYAEVLRVKTVAEQVASGKNLVVLFDELFKGTNVQDAFDGTFAVTQEFSKYRNCFFIISTHIIEAGHALRDQVDGLRFAYLPTYLNGNKPQYTYQLENGVTNDRQGMTIIENEGILEILK